MAEHLAIVFGVNGGSQGNAILTSLPITAQILDAVVIDSSGTPPIGTNVKGSISNPVLVPNADNIEINNVAGAGSSRTVLLIASGAILAGATILLLYSTP